MQDDLAARRLILWSGVASAALAVLFDVFIGLGIAGAPTRLPAVAASLLLALAFVVFVSAIHASTDAGRRVWTQIALSFALLYAALLSWNYFLQLTVVRADPKLYGWLSMDFTSVSSFWALEVIGYAMMGLSTLFLLPVVPSGPRGKVARWAFVANAAFTIVGAVGYGVSGDPLGIPVLLSLGVWSIAFPLGVALLATRINASEN